jgi:hypothetical protein
MIPKLLFAGIVLVFLGVTGANAGPCSIEIATFAKALASRDAGSGPPLGAQPPNHFPSNQSDRHPPTTTMGEQTDGKATSPEDVRQNAGQPTSAQSGSADADSVTDRTVVAINALKLAQFFDRQGRQRECMEAIREAKQIIGPR